jgi:Penicillin binding protein transpeptidase domain
MRKAWFSFVAASVPVVGARAALPPVVQHPAACSARLPCGPVEQHREGPKEWDRDHELASALKFSVVWFYQEIARRIGAERMQSKLNAFN